ncbi:carbohydrate ABC transporter membrane protein 1, CUT1 family [Paenibacillus aquistagni]|uniref:Carbohydrate ABC transporter membrane protein 1, CUT1 family n=2 Tax=Paenibacillus aquistagni TaxID=1852522 RepID=A0A1X7L897_9BACL|nr:carbohydrate ABC transporter membrane protein 1, CUT1 family [Paenibacillus aquistagni]
MARDTTVITGMAAGGSATTRQRSQLWKRICSHYQLYLMLLPCVIFFIIFSYIPMGGLVLAFKEYQFNKGIFGSPWIGLTYFEMFFQDPQSWRLIRNTLVISGMKVFLAMPFPILLALMFNEVKNSRLRNLFQGIAYLPHFFSWVIVVGIMQRILAPDTGLVNQVISWLGGDGSTFFMMEEGAFHPMMFWSYVWKDVGWSSIIYYAAIVGINPALYEAAKIDGANKWRQIWHITLPGIRSTIIVLFILSLGSILSAGFDQIYLLKTPGNMNVSEILDTYIIYMGLESGQFGFGTAIGMMQGIVGLILVLTVNKVAKKWFQSSLW